MKKISKMTDLNEKSEYEKIMSDYANSFGTDIGNNCTCSIKSAGNKQKLLNSVNGELILKKR